MARLSRLFKILVYRVKFPGFPLLGSERHRMPGRVSTLFTSLRFPKEQKQWLFNDVPLLFIKGLGGVSKNMLHKTVRELTWVIHCKGLSVWS